MLLANKQQREQKAKSIFNRIIKDAAGNISTELTEEQKHSGRQSKRFHWLITDASSVLAEFDNDRLNAIFDSAFSEVLRELPPYTDENLAWETALRNAFDKSFPHRLVAENAVNNKELEALARALRWLARKRVPPKGTPIITRKNSEGEKKCFI